ncbi:hypothetical protein AK812_SmicGene22238 [Symbiodinium microadriaticum]|uniref:UBA domain-containing protein n=1 Tax=Symbiodinium microadriaticum TaxID=2951 RepID=A0A1Q9DKD9_SYMMI|nr:hypothetical protein AK812_SmicGene22238 [Symbiodinium microadriaticum]
MPGKVKDESKKVEKLVKLGFEMGSVLEALASCNGDTKQAAVLLLQKEKERKKAPKKQGSGKAAPSTEPPTPSPSTKASAPTPSPSEGEAKETPTSTSAPKTRKTEKKPDERNNSDDKEKKEPKEKKGREPKEKKDLEKKQAREEKKEHQEKNEPLAKKPRVNLQEPPSTPPPQSQAASPVSSEKLPEKIELRNLNPRSMAKFFDSDTYKKEEQEHRPEAHKISEMDRRDTLRSLASHTAETSPTSIELGKGYTESAGDTSPATSSPPPPVAASQSAKPGYASIRKETFGVLKEWLLNDGKLGSIRVEEFVKISETMETDQYVTMTVLQMEKEFGQKGAPHPQAPTIKKARMYKVLRALVDERFKSFDEKIMEKVRELAAAKHCKDLVGMYYARSLSSIYEYDLEIFQSIFLGHDADSNLREYWAQNSKSNWFKNHPMLSKLTAAELMYVIPLEVHGDDAELHKRRSFSISTVSSALTTGSTWDHKLLLSCFDNSAAGESTSSEIDCWICWGLVCASAGKYLDHDWHGRKFDETYMPQLAKKAGRSIAGDFRFVFAGHKGFVGADFEEWHESMAWYKPGNRAPTFSLKSLKSVASNRTYPLEHLVYDQIQVSSPIRTATYADEDLATGLS